MSVDSQSFEARLRVRNETWRDYRVQGTCAFPSSATHERLYRRHCIQNPRPLPNRNSLHFFDNWKWTPRLYETTANTVGEIHRLSDFDPIFNQRSANAQARYRELTAYFGDPRYAVQKVLGMGGNGMAVHFKDRGSSSTDDPGRDIVVKVALDDWQSDAIVEEKNMMKKVKGSAHCVQIIDPEDVGMSEEEPVVLPLADCDSSTEGDSSGNDSSTRVEVRRRHRIPKRMSRNDRYWRRKRERRRIRNAEVEEKIEIQEQIGQRRDYIIMEYLQNGSLAGLIVKLNELKADKIPNRVLWGFWLCLIRACIAMEYPPRKFHPLRNKPQSPEGAVPFLQAKANNMIRECKRLGIRLFDPQEYARMEAQYNQLEGDLVENLPNPTEKESLNWKRERRQNMVHRDLDPTNIFVDGFELDEPALIHWQETSNSFSNTNGYTGKRPDRLHQEHELIPRLKIGDFGLAICIKPEKRNDYYLWNRVANKPGEHPPEFFGPEWEKVEGGQDGDYLANSRTCGYYSNKTNIWSIAMTMWELITKTEAPVPPNPQPPYNLRDMYPPYNNEGQIAFDLIFHDPAYADFKISYCPLLLDPDVHDYDWVHKTLRETIFKCLYHKPDDRPTLEELLREAEENLRVDFGETDAYIRDWIQRYFFNSPSPPPAQSSSSGNLPPQGNPQPPLPSGFIPPPGPAGGSSAPQQPNVDPVTPQNAISQDDRDNTVRHQMRVRFNNDFPYGWTRIPNAATGLMCGLHAIEDSLRHQLGLQPIINGVRHNLNNLPAVYELQAIHHRLKDSGHFDPFFTASQLAQDNTFSVDTLGLILSEWGRTMNIELALGCMLGGQNDPMHTMSPYNNPKFIWIYNNNAQDLAINNQAAGPIVINHYEGIKPEANLPKDDLPEDDLPEDDLPEDDLPEDDLPSYESSG
ncbi:hypothetical protein F4824DRAFT_516098 [Ustulina deusta]|nr:hypothetical protein F4824DRAFT_516098 [Ustulina deusta]